ncbi:MAG: hypothetical protein ABI167_04745 [Nitrosospira sp.]
MLIVTETEVFSRYARDYLIEDEREAFPSGLQNTITPVTSCAALAVVAKYVGHVKESVKAVVCV